MQPLYNADELRIEIFKFIKTPISLLTTNRKWYDISQDPHTRAEWLIYKYGKAHALFHAVRLGETFVTRDVVESLLAKNAIISRYFSQRLLMHFGTFDEKLRRERNINQADSNRIPIFQCCPWASNLSLPVFNKLITEGYNRLSDNDLAVRGNDMELFHFLSAGPSGIDNTKIYQNLNLIGDLILNQKFIPFPPRPKPTYEDTIEYIHLMRANTHEEYPSKDGYENSRHLDDIAGAILAHPDLVIMWKEIGYHEICSDFNELVMQGALSNLFPSTPPDDWEHPSMINVVERLRQLINLGFQLTDIVMEEALRSFEHRLDEIGDLLMSSFQIIHKESRSDIACSILIHAIKPERNLKRTDLLEYLRDRIDQPEKALKKVLEYHNVGFKFDPNTIKSTKKIRSLSVHPSLYYWILLNYGPDSEITQKCFEDIIESRIWIDLKLQETPERDVPEKITSRAFNSICSIYLEFCNEKVPFKISYLQYLQLASNEEIIKPFFGISLPMVFGLSLKCNLPFEITYERDRPEIKLVNRSNKRKFYEMNETNDNHGIEEWSTLLETMHFGQIYSNNSNITEIFRINFEEFWEELHNCQTSMTGIQSFVIAEQPTRVLNQFVHMM